MILAKQLGVANLPEILNDFLVAFQLIPAATSAASAKASAATALVVATPNG